PSQIRVICRLSSGSGLLLPIDLLPAVVGVRGVLAGHQTLPQEVGRRSLYDRDVGQIPGQDLLQLVVVGSTSLRAARGSALLQETVYLIGAVVAGVRERAGRIAVIQTP